MAIKRKRHIVKDAAGAPSKYQDEYGEALVLHMAEGGSLTSFAHKIGVHRDTVYEWAKVHAKFSDALKRGEAALESWFEGLFKRMAAGQLPPRVKSETTVKDKKGNVTTTKTYEYPTGNASSAIFMAQNMIHWRNRKDIQLTGEGGGPIKYTDLTTKQLKNIIKEGLEILGIDTSETE